MYSTRLGTKSPGTLNDRRTCLSCLQCCIDSLYRCIICPSLGLAVTSVLFSNIDSEKMNFDQ